MIQKKFPWPVSPSFHSWRSKPKFTWTGRLPYSYMEDRAGELPEIDKEAHGGMALGLFCGRSVCANARSGASARDDAFWNALACMWVCASLAKPTQKPKTPFYALRTGFSIIGVIPLGFEPKTHSLEGCCSIQLSYGTRTILK